LLLETRLLGEDRVRLELAVVGQVADADFGVFVPAGERIYQREDRLPENESVCVRERVKDRGRERESVCVRE